MDSVSIILFLLISVALFILIFKQFRKNPGKPRAESLTKEDIILGYEKLVKDLIKNNSEDKEVLLEKKSQLLKHISKDLHNNIFFDEKEAKEIILKLASL